MKDWYSKKIEKPIRKLVKLLRDNGFNTVCSCGHEPSPYVQMDLSIRDSCLAERLFDFLQEHGYKNYIITLTLDAFIHKAFLEVRFVLKSRLCNEKDLKRKW